MKKFYLIFVLIMTTSLVFSQKDKVTNWDFAVRGKIAAFFVIEDAYFSTGTIGAEFIFKKRHSIGIDYSFFNWQYQTDSDFIDSNGNQLNDIPMYDEYERKSYVLIDYKYIFSFLSSETVWYINVYNRYGTFNKWYDLNYNEEYFYLNYNMQPANNSSSFLHSTTKGIFNESGLGIGFKNYFNQTNFGLDMSVNGGYKYSKNNIKNTSNPGITAYTNDVKSTRFVFFVRLNLFYKFNFDK